MNRTQETNTKHNHAVVFGRRQEGCPRCSELKAGAAPRQGWGQAKREMEAQQLQAIRRHDFSACAAANGVCTHFDW